jgi:hypothetical protein
MIYFKKKLRRHINDKVRKYNIKSHGRNPSSFQNIKLINYYYYQTLKRVIIIY